MSNVPTPLSWHALQEALRICATEQEVEAIMNAEAAGRKRERWLRRINARRSALRRERELSEITKIATGDA